MPRSAQQRVYARHSPLSSSDLLWRAIDPKPSKNPGVSAGVLHFVISLEGWT
jgi:hypothetical protein